MNGTMPMGIAPFGVQPILGAADMKYFRAGGPSDTLRPGRPRSEAY